MLSTRKKTPSAGNPVSGMRVHVVSWQSSWPQSHNSLASVTDVRSGRLTGELPTHNSHTANYDSTVFIRVSNQLDPLRRKRPTTLPGRVSWGCDASLSLEKIVRHSLRSEIEEVKEEAAALADRAKRTARQAEVLADRNQTP
jgi:hypothetical protein